MAENWVKVARDLGYGDETSMWIDLYLTQGLSIEQIHQRLSYGTHTIIRRLDHCNINRRSPGGPCFSPNQRAKLFHLDQRVIWSLTIKELSNLTGVSPALISKYKNLYGGKCDGVCDYLPNSGTREVCNVVEDTSSVGTD